MKTEDIDAVIGSVFNILDAVDNIVGLEFSEEEDGSRYVTVFAHDPNLLDLPSETRVEVGGASLMVTIRVSKAEGMKFDLGTPDDKSLFEDFSPAEADRFIGMGGTRIWYDGGWGTISLSIDQIDISLTARDGSVQRCHREGAMVISNAHVLEPNGKEVRFRGLAIGPTVCHFDLRAVPTLDYGHAEWAQNVTTGNYGRVFLDRNTPGGRRLTRVRPVAQGETVSKQGARTGWTSGRVGNRNYIKHPDGGWMWGWSARYASDGGDSGSPVLADNGNGWDWVGVHTGKWRGLALFWSFDTIGQQIASGSLPSQDTEPSK